MMTGKRALIVDDSRSARVILSRMLEQHGMAVDTAESAEQALEYLRAEPSGRDLHGPPDARHGRVPGRAGDQERPADRDDSAHDVHLAGRRAVREPGARARRRRRAAEDRAAGRRLARALPAAPAAGSAPAPDRRCSTAARRARLPVDDAEVANGDSAARRGSGGAGQPRSRRASQPARSRWRSCRATSARRCSSSSATSSPSSAGSWWRRSKRLVAASAPSSRTA